MRHSAWLNATPKESERSRRDTYAEGSAYTILPTLTEYEQHLAKLWREVGSISNTGMGAAPLLWGEIIDWADRFYSQEYIHWVVQRVGKRKPTRIPVIVKQSSLEDYELEIIMQLSREYCDEYHSATDPSRPCPKEIFLDEVDKELEGQAQLEAFMSVFGVMEN